MIREPLRAVEIQLFTGMPDEQERTLRFRGGSREFLRDLERTDGARAVVVGTIVDGIEPRRTNAMQAVEADTYSRALRGRDAFTWKKGKLSRSRYVETRSDRVERAQ